MELYYSNLSINKYDDGIVFYNDNLLNAKNDDKELSMSVICSDWVVFGPFLVCFINNKSPCFISILNETRGLIIVR